MKAAMTAGYEVAMEKILLFQVDAADTDVIREIAGRMQMKVQSVPKEHFTQTLEELVNASVPQNPYTATGPDGSLIVMCGLEETHMDRFLKALREKQIRSDYKAILTPTNSKWNVLRLYAEMAREKAEFEKLRGNRD